MPFPIPPHGLPWRAALNADGLHLALLDIAAGELHDPFLHETVQRLQPTQSVVHIPPAELARTPPSFEPAGLIFHVARCGSTLVSQSLKQHEGLVVYSEPLAINELLLSPTASARADRVAALRSLGAQFSLHAGRPYVLKLSSWNTLFCDLVADAFPTAPWAVCLRDPLEVCVSLLESQPSWLRSDKAALFSATANLGSPTHGAEDRAARFFAAFCDAVTRLDPARGMLLAYENLPDAIWSRLALHFRLALAAATRDGMAQVAKVYSKSRTDQGSVAFSPDGDRKRAAASAGLRHVVDAIARPPYDRLRSIMPG